MTVVPKLETARLALRGWRADDLDDWAAICADDEVTRPLGQPGGLSREDAWREMAFLAGHWELKGFGHWALEERWSGALVGRTGLFDPESWPGLELGWLVARPRWGQGYAGEGARAAMGWAAAELRADHLISLITDENVRSQRVAEKLSMAVEGRTRHRGFEVRVYGVDLPGSSAE